MNVNNLINKNLNKKFKFINYLLLHVKYQIHFPPQIMVFSYCTIPLEPRDSNILNNETHNE